MRPARQSERNSLNSSLSMVYACRLGGTGNLGTTRIRGHRGLCSLHGQVWSVTTVQYGLGGDPPMKIVQTKTAPNPRRVRIFLAEKGIEVPYEEVDILKGLK